MSLMRLNPFREMQEFQNTVNRLFDSALSRRFEEADQDLVRARWIPPVDLYEMEGALVFTAELPGFKKEQVQITVDEGRLVISGERKFEEFKDRKTHQVERAYGTFYRSFVLPTTVNTEKISAGLKDGILTVTLPKKEEAKPRQIQVSAQ